MDRALTPRFDTPATLSPFRYRYGSSLAITRRFAPAIVCAKRSPIDGVSDELNLIASQNLDQAPARRLARSAFVDLQLQLDHCLFKVALTHTFIAK
jgi:acylglycerol lipase